ncbi:hypothetical protein DID88_008195 [Monilinia fructigena]|uniref:Uncharacterized protein n=1 Tax=Monilinia fructigena TaxID=38457 RepID=A0A395J4P2_9HELO|nr:hypothetical protein DID88_008195 [Monilinia fructigena]
MAGKKRKASGQSAKSTREDFDKSKGKVAFTTYEDIADSEDEFHINRDKVMLDEEPHAKRQRKLKADDNLIEQSDEEILGYSEESSEEEEEVAEAAKPKKSKAQQSDDEGLKRKMRMLRDGDLRNKKLQKMSEADFGFDENEWLGEGGDDEEGDVVTEVLKDVEITEEMGPEKD